MNNNNDNNDNNDRLDGKYKEGRGCLKVPILLLLQRFYQFLAMIPWYLTHRECLIPRILPEERAEWGRKGFAHHNGYNSVAVKSTQVGMHTLSWIARHNKHPKEGKYLANLVTSQ